jgi:hypothetical protein
VLRSGALVCSSTGCSRAGSVELHGVLRAAVGILVFLFDDDRPFPACAHAEHV